MSSAAKAKGAATQAKEKAGGDNCMVTLPIKVAIMAALSVIFLIFTPFSKWLKMFLVAYNMKMVAGKKLMGFLCSDTNSCNLPEGMQWKNMLLANLLFIALVNLMFPHQAGGFFAFLSKESIVTVELVRWTIGPTFLVFLLNSTGLLSFKALYGTGSPLLCIYVAVSMVMYAGFLARATYQLLPALMTAAHHVSFTSLKSFPLCITLSLILFLWYQLTKNMLHLFKGCCTSCQKSK